ncbi:threonylcarbamoyl-AMP synthase [Chromobacterium sphagni]|uniref:Threonylcarbamoyl-AMP synthase n=1 Tax=Chromobacterium sphagni TaxID=1903179 RepID=A0A1S1WVI3_9NEIS|nr:L-threonylcarbamoyladenylate synthase [Chromobacterium sphagni]OHX11249.1 threonylcarbamoyl-AMP synthase [Chromobacterium sphagni]
MKSLSPTPEGLDQAAALLRAGELVAVPTETVYGLAADATQPDAVAAIFRAKNRPADHPLIVHLPGLEQLNEWAARVPDCAWPVIERFWPGPLTLVVPASPKVPAIVNAGQNTVALRWSSHPLLQALLDRLQRPVAAPSANPFCRISPTTADHVRAHMEGRIAAVVDGGPCAVGIESTILDLSGARPAILRPGAITAAMLAPYLDLAEAAAPDAPRVPGNLASHYAPRQPCYRLEAAEAAAAAAAAESAHEAGWQHAAVLAIEPPAARCGWFKRMPPTPEGYAQTLYSALHEADVSGCLTVWIVLPPDEVAWRAVRDRLQRAAQPLDGHVLNFV